MGLGFYFSDADHSQPPDEHGRGGVTCYRLSDRDLLTAAAHAARWIRRIEVPVP